MRAALVATCLLGACRAEPACEENLGAQVLDERVALRVGEHELEAELADDEVERERGWRKRACDREALLLVPDEPASLPVWGCDLIGPIDVLPIESGQVLFVERLEPCALPCGGCPTVLEDVVVEAVLEVPAGTLDVAGGDPVEGI